MHLLFSRYRPVTASLLAAACVAAGGIFWARTGGIQLWAQPGTDRMSKSITALTGGRTKVVWCQDCSEMTDAYAMGNHLQLAGYDTDDSRGARLILTRKRNYSRPLISPDGNCVLFSDRKEKAVFRVDWDGNHLARFCPGRALDTWLDPETGMQWVYVGDAATDHPRYHGSVRRYRIDDPSVSEPVLDTFSVNENNFQVSANGRFASADIRGEGMGVIDLEKGEFHYTGGGCWPALAPAGSLVCWRMANGHRDIFVHTLNEECKIDISNAPGVDGYEVFHARWSNHPRFFTISGPYNKGMGFNRISNGGTNVNIYIGKFTDDFSAIEGWACVSNSTCACFYPDVWIGRN